MAPDELAGRLALGIERRHPLDKAGLCRRASLSAAASCGRRLMASDPCRSRPRRICFCAKPNSFRSTKTLSGPTAERILHVARRKELYEKLHPETKHGGDRRSAGARSSSQNENLKAFVADIAVKTGKGRSTVARDVTRAKKVAVLDDIAGTRIPGQSTSDRASENALGRSRKRFKFGAGTLGVYRANLRASASWNRSLAPRR